MATPQPDPEDATRAPFELVILAGHTEVGRRFRLGEGSYVIGRTEGADLRIANDTVGRRHARITVQEGRVSIEDLSSPCGIYVDDQRASAAELSPGAHIRIGAVVLELVGGEIGAARA